VVCHRHFQSIFFLAVMGRHYSRVSNYAIGQTVRIIVFGIVGFMGARLLLPRLGLVHTAQDLTIGCVIAAVLLAAVAKRYT
jgi:uncharacterized membrane protein YeaQ/YmgE (transglycosylase-associated protein family)